MAHIIQAAAHAAAHPPAHADAPHKIWALQLACTTLFCIAFCAAATWYIHDPAPGTWEMGDVLFGMLYALGAGVILRAALGLLSFAARFGTFSSHQ